LLIERDYMVAPLADPAVPALDADDDAPEIRAWTIAADGHGRRLDQELVAHAGEFSRSHLQSLVERGEVRIDGDVCALPSRRLKLGQQVELALVPTAESRAFRAEPMRLPLVYEDDALLVIDKPVGLVVHPAAGHWSGTLLNGLLAHHRGAASLPRAGIVHRLDKDTSGLMVVAKTLPAMTALTRAIAARNVQREYLALAHGEFADLQRTIEAPIARDPRSRVRMAVLAAGKPARTDVRRLAVRGGVSALRCTLHTGRTHQIRVHLAHAGHPLLADTLYGGRPQLGMTRQALHAAVLRFEHPVEPGRTLAFEALPPQDLARAWRQVTGEP
jgi:23S rRNA pseudouridine1911/1915/1917 synthase